MVSRVSFSVITDNNRRLEKWDLNEHFYEVVFILRFLSSIYPPMKILNMGNVLFFTPEDFSLAVLVSSTCKENFVHPFCKLKWLVVHYIDPDPFKLRLGMESSF